MTNNNNHKGDNMKITTKAKAMSILTDSLFNPVNGHTLSIGKFDGGKYKWTGSQKHYVGKEVTDIDWVHAVYVERRTDSDGPYAQLMSIGESV